MTTPPSNGKASKLAICLVTGAVLYCAGPLFAQDIVVDAAPAHMANSFSPFRALGGAIDRLNGGATKEANEKNTKTLLSGPVLDQLLGAGWQTVTYRQEHRTAN